MTTEDTPRLTSVASETGAFRDRALRALFLLLAIAFATNILLYAARDNVLSDTVKLGGPDGVKTYLSEPFDAERSALLPGHAIHVDARLPDNYSASYEVALVMADNNDAFGFEQGVWQENGTWSEGGESGTWYESDLSKEFIFVPHETGAYRLRFDLMQMAAANQRQPLEHPSVALKVSVTRDYASTVAIWCGFVVVLLGTLLAIISIWMSGLVVFEEWLADDWAQTGGTWEMDVDEANTKDSLIKIVLEINRETHGIDEGYPVFEMQAIGPDGRGVRIDDVALPIKTKKDDSGNPTRRFSRHTYHFVPSMQGTHRLSLAVTKEAHVVTDGVLRVRSGVRTAGKVEAHFAPRSTSA